jgi:hypothetical protein
MGIEGGYVTNMADKKLSNRTVAQIVDNEGIGYAIQHYMSADSIADPELAALWTQANEILSKIERVCVQAENADEDCEFDHPHPHEWHCTVHDSVEIGSASQEPVNCSVRRNEIEHGEG